MEKKIPAYPKPEDITSILTELKMNLKASRYQHTIGVAYTAASMGMRYGIDIDRCLKAGLLHDCAKCMDPDEMVALIEKSGEEPTEYELRNPQLLHQRAGSILAHNHYHVIDQEILDAIRHHTTGAPGMSMLEKIVFIADFIEPGRYVAPHLKELRELAFTDIDQCLLHILDDTIEYLKSTGALIDPTTQETFEYYQERITLEPYKMEGTS